RREVGVATTFNFLGPLANPSRPAASAIGVAALRMAPILAGGCARPGSSALVFHGDDGLGELTATPTPRVWGGPAGSAREHSSAPGLLGIPPADLASLRGGVPTQNAAIARSTLGGQHGPVRDAVVLNAAAALVAYDLQPGLGLHEQMRSAMQRSAV